MEGSVNASQGWNLAIGQGWIFRLVPIQPGPSGYGGWDLVVDRVSSQGYPDALLLATPPYGSLNEREIGTTFGLRAQDAIGWNPRTFRFLTDPAKFRQAKADYLAFMRSSTPQGRSQNDATADPDKTSAGSRLLDLAQHGSQGEFRILDAHLAPGTGDPAPYARQWAVSHTPYEVDPVQDGKSTRFGAIHSLRFSLTLWLPGAWQLPDGLHAVETACGR